MDVAIRCQEYVTLLLTSAEPLATLRPTYGGCVNTRLKDWRARNGATLEDLSDLTGSSSAMLSRVTRGERRLSALARIRIARALNAKVATLFPVEDRQHGA